MILVAHEIMDSNMQFAILSSILSDLDLRDASGGRGYALEVEPSQGPVVPGHGPLSLQYVYLDLGLVVGRGREYFFFPGGDGRVSGYECRHAAAHGLTSPWKGRYIQKEDILN